MLARSIKSKYSLAYYIRLQTHTIFASSNLTTSKPSDLGIFNLLTHPKLVPMKTIIITITAIIALASCTKPQLPEVTTPQQQQHDNGTVSREESPPTARYEFLCLEGLPCNAVVLTGYWKVMYAGCQANPNDADPVPLKVWYREYQWTNCVAGNPVSPGWGWYLDSNNCSVSGRSKWVRMPLVTPPASDVWLGSCNNGVPVNPNNDPNYTGFDSNYWEPIYSNCSNGLSFFWKYQ